MKLRILFLFVFMISLSLASCTSVETSPIQAVDPGVNPDSWATVPAGEFFYGRHDYEEVIEYDYQMMVTHVTNKQYADYLTAALAENYIQIEGDAVTGYYPGDPFDAYEHEEEISEGDYIHMPLEDPVHRLEFANGAFSVVAGYENHPVTLVSWFGARAYCQYYGWELPSEYEWEKAARGTDTRPFPWGDEIERNRANYYSSHDLFEKLSGVGNTTPVGFFNGQTYEGYETLDNSSPYGIYDMSGNVWQWTRDDYPKQHYRYLRGGSKESYAYDLRVWTRNSAGPEFFSPNIGFRCVELP
jgi:formylglycine-generating enzyme required for sulfatase activity